jgi:hypothetical protein
MPVQPQAAIHGECHSRFSVLELAIPARQRVASKVAPDCVY